MIKNLDRLVKEKLLSIAKKLRIPNASTLNKSELISKIKKEEVKQSKQKSAPKSKSKLKTKSKSPATRKQTSRIEPPLAIHVRLKTRSVEAQQGFVHPYSESAMHVEGEPSHEIRYEHDLPSSYGVTKIVLMVRDPYWCYTYWDFSAPTRSQITRWYRELTGPKAVLRIYDVTNRNFDGTNANSFFDLDINFDAGNWYLEVGKPDRSFLVEIGIRDQYGRFYVIARSNVVRTPRDTPSDVIDEEWMSREFELLYAASGGFKIGISSGELMDRIKKGVLFREWLSSGAFSSRASAK